MFVVLGDDDVDGGECFVYDWFFLVLCGVVCRLRFCGLNVFGSILFIGCVLCVVSSSIFGLLFF